VEIIEKVIEKNYPRNIMEIGAGTTWVASKLIKSLKPETYYAIDPTLQTTNEKINVIRDYYPTDKLREKYFDLIIGFNVLEHVSDPMIFMNNIRKNLPDGGMAILTFPDCEGQFKRGDINVLIHEHVSYFTEESILWITKIIGFDVISLDSKNDLFTLVIQKSQKKHEVKTQNINELILLKYGAEMFINLLDKVTEKIRISLKENNNLAFHGATQGLNTFFHLTGLGEHPNISIYDGDRSKSGMYLPASVAPIKHYTDESYGENSMIVISAMSFYQQILDVIISKNKYSEHQIIPLAADAL
jgi:2-polyprenyl-3-methyl-5-hydroxy-6-metoxy-1,4-benzoquinol methylase